MPRSFSYLTVLLSTVLLPPAALAEQDRHHMVDEILVTARPFDRAADSALAAGNVVAGEELSRRVQGSLGESLAGLPGISSTYFGPAASRPVIRGLGGDRVRILNGGIGSFDAASVSPDHAVAIDLLAAERIEIVRGPGTLLYGGAAVGGVINVFDGRIPTRLPDDNATGAAQFAYGTAAEERAAAGAATVAVGRFAVHVDGAWRKTDDLEIPGYAQSKRLRNLDGIIPDPATHGRLLNSASKTQDGAIGVSYIADNGYLGVAYSRNDMTYDVPTAPDSETSIDLNQNRFDVMGETSAPFLVFDKAKLRFGYGDYDHSERDAGVVATTFFNKSWEGRLELVQNPIGNLNGALGVQVAHRDFSAVGEEVAVPPSITASWGIFAVEELTLEAWTLEGGLRYERQTTDVKTAAPDRTFNTVSISAGLSRDLGGGFQAGVTLSRTERAPSAEELYYNGAHDATGSFEVGDPNLKTEAAKTAEINLRKKDGRLTGALSLYYMRFNNFIYEAANGDVEDGLPVFVFSQADAKFYGGELELTYLAYESGGFNVNVDVAADMVRASLANNGGPLPRIPPKSLTVGVAAQGEWFDARVEVEMHDKQTRVTAFELPTDGYTFLNFSASAHPFAAHDLTLSVRARNLTNEEARNHVSFLKDVAPMPGRDVRLSATYKF